MTAASRQARAEAISGRRAGLLTRLTADGVDFLVAAALYFGILVGFAVVRYMVTGDSLRLPRPGGTFSAIAFPVVAATYLTITWRATGRSVGKRLMGLRVMRGNGGPLGFWRSAFRAVACVLVGGLSLLWAAVSRRNAAVHDIVFRTAVVHDWPNVVHWTPPVETPVLEESA